MARMRKKKNLIPRMEKAGVYYIPELQNLKGHWREYLGLDQNCRIMLELGCGKGTFALKNALKIKSESDNSFFIALDKVKEAIVVGMEKAYNEDNTGSLPLKFISADCSKLEEIFDKNEVNEIFINFCDPWPSNGHQKRRITWDGFLKIYSTIMDENGILTFKTDNENLYDFSLERLKVCGYSIFEESRDLHKENIDNITTEYEEKFSAMGMPIYYAKAKSPNIKND